MLAVSNRRFCEKGERVIIGLLDVLVPIQEKKTLHKTPTNSFFEHSWSSDFKHIKKYDDGVLGKRQRDHSVPIREKKNLPQKPSSLICFSCIALKPCFIFMYCPETLLYFHVLP